MITKILSFFSRVNPRAWKWATVISVVGAVLSGFGAFASWIISNSEYNLIKKPQATLESQMATLQSNQALLERLEATNTNALYQPYLIMRPFVAESPTINSDNDLANLDKIAITIAQILPSSYYQQVKEKQSYNNPELRYIFILFINRGEKMAKTITFDGIIWKPKINEVAPNGLDDFYKEKEILKVDFAYALLVDEALNITLDNLLNAAHFEDICVNFSYTNLFDLSQRYLGYPCISQVANQAYFIIPFR